MNIIILGSPASGKGTQAKLLSKKLGLYHLQTGDIARKLAKNDLRIREIVNSGKLIPEEEMTMHVFDFLLRHKSKLSGILFEGFPRFISQYTALDEFLKNKGDDIDAVISIDISKKEAVKRISARRTCEGCGEIYNLITNPPPNGGCRCGGKLIQREDDNPKSVKIRFQYYRDNTKKLMDYLDEKGILIKIDGERSINTINEDILKHLREKE